MIEVLESNEMMVFKVASESRKGQHYRVDLLYGGGAGFCECRDHQTRRQPFIDKGGDPFSRPGCCKHTIHARRYFLRGLLKSMAEKEEK